MAILGIRRAEAGRLTGQVEFSRLTPTTRDIIIPAGLHVTGPESSDGTSVPVLETIESVRIGEGERRVVANVQEIPGSESESWTVLSPGTLTIMPRPVLGVEVVTNPSPITRDSQAESDASLRERARVVLRQVQQGTTEAIEAAARERGVADVRVIEPEGGPPGWVFVRIGDPEFERAPGRLQAVEEAVLASKPAGVRATVQYLRTVYADIILEVEPEDPDMDAAGFERLADALRQSVTGFVAALPPGVSLSRRKLDAVVLGHPAVRDLSVTVQTVTLQYPDDPTAEPQKTIDTGERELPNGDWYIEPLESLAIDSTRWPPQVRRRQVKMSRLDLRVDVQETALAVETLQDNIRAAVAAYTARLRLEDIDTPDGPVTVRRMTLATLTAHLRDQAQVTDITQAMIVRTWSGLVEHLTAETDVLLEPAERMTVERIDINLETGA